MTQSRCTHTGTNVVEIFAWTLRDDLDDFAAGHGPARGALVCRILAGFVFVSINEDGKAFHPGQHWKEPDPAGRSGRPYGPQAGQLRSNASLDTFCYC
jgi:hypothetical protein